MIVVKSRAANRSSPYVSSKGLSGSVCDRVSVVSLLEGPAAILNALAGFSTRLSLLEALLMRRAASTFRLHPKFAVS